jgi:tetratricopeptide (TPR) repeat protein
MMVRKMDVRIVNCPRIFLFLVIMFFLVPPALKGEEKAHVYVNLGLSYYKMGRYEKAAEQFRQAGVHPPSKLDGIQQGLLLGSVSTKVRHLVECPCVTVK